MNQIIVDRAAAFVRDLQDAGLLYPVVLNLTMTFEDRFSGEAEGVNIRASTDSLALLRSGESGNLSVTIVHRVTNSKTVLNFPYLPESADELEMAYREIDEKMAFIERAAFEA